MMLNKQKVLWVCMVVSLGLLLGSLLIYIDYAGRGDSYDSEVLNSYGDDELQLTKDYAEEETTSPDGTSEVPIPADALPNGVTAGERYNDILVAEDTRNILIIGEDKENKLYDTIGIANIDAKNKNVKIIMLPRDLYIEYSKPVMDVIQAEGKADVAGIYKLNTAHYIGAMVGYKGKFSAKSISFLAEVIKEKFGVDVDDYIKIDTSGFDKVVNLFGGIDINVPYDMNYDDPVQDLHIHLAKGMQHLDGEQAEGFVRFRQGYREDGTRFDVDRKTNQLAFIKAFIKQHGTISNINKVPELLNTLNKNIKHSIGFGDMLLTYTGLARDIISDKYEIESININGSEKNINGSSYTVLK